MRSKNQIVSEHGLTINALIKRLEKKSRSEMEIANLERLRKRISLLRNVSEDALIIEMFPTMSSYSEKILNRDETFFMTADARKEFITINKREPTSQEEFIFDLIKSVRLHYSKSAQAEKDSIYQEVLKVFNCCVEYQLQCM